MKQRFPELTICINGGITTLEQAKTLLDQGLDGVMIGRAAYHDPANTLIGADALWGDPYAPDPFTVIDALRPYIAEHLAAREAASTRSPATCWAFSPGNRGQGAGGACCPKAPAAKGQGCRCWTVRWMR
jgi:tRNA-dihydrouridine synthase A